MTKGNVETARLTVEASDEAEPYYPIRRRAFAGTGPATGTGCVHEVFEARAARCPHAAAVSSTAGADLSYAQLNAGANQLARHLRGMGVGAGSLVGVCLERDVGLTAALLGVVKSGGAYVPLDPYQPVDRLRFMLSDAGVSVVITASALASRFAGAFAGRLVLLDVDRAAVEEWPCTNLEPVARPDGPLYVIYTSGSTGRPKGVTITHANVLRLFTAQPHVSFDASDTWTLFHSYGFDFSVWEMWGALLYGGRLVVVPQAVSRSPDDFLDLLVEQRVTVLNQTPSAFRALVDLARADDPRLERLALRAVIFGGEKLEPASLRPWVDRLGLDRPELINMYGITETTVHVTYHRLRPEDIDASGASPIGSPLSDLRIHVLDGNARPVPQGVPGEIYVGGPGLALGYLNRPDLTAERFVADPFGPPGGRMYRSGDLARRRPGGDLEYLGRADDQVQIRGFRVELGEIESALLAHPSVRQAAVSAHEGRAGDTWLAGYVVPENASAPSSQELRGHLARTLPEYMLPSAYVTMRTLPLTANGKLDRARLPVPVRTASGRAPRTPRGELLCELFADVLELPSVGVDDDFFELGGHSLTAIRLTNRIRAIMGMTVPIETLFAAPTVAELVQRLAEDPDRPPLVPMPRPETIPLSLAQQRLWFLHHAQGASPAYHIPLALHLSGPVDEAALAAAVHDVVSRHEVLRTVYPETAGVPYQKILDPEDAQPAVQTRHVDSDELVELMRAAARQPFDLSRDLPLRAWLFRTAADQSVLLLVLHHIAGDGWSLGPLASDLSTAYTARCSGAVPVWEGLPVQYADYALWQQGAVANLDEQLDHWRQHLQGAPEELELPADRPRPLTASYEGDLVRFDIPAGLHRDLSRLARASGATLHMVLQAAVAALLTRLNAGTDLPIGTAIAGRTDHALENLIGFFVNALVVRTDTSGDPTFAELVRRVRTASVSAYVRQDVPFERLVEVMNPVRSVARHPLFQVIIASHNNAPTQFGLPGLTVRLEPVPMGTAKFDLSFKFDERPEPGRGMAGLAAELEYSTDLFDLVTADQLVIRLVRLLRAVCADPGARLSTIDILGAEERRRMVEWNRTTAAFPEELTIAQLFERQADRTPDTVALAQQHRRWTFRELDERANQIAHVLRSLGVGQESRVGVSIYRSPELIAALLGVWKAGGAYVPTDPDYPADRLNYMFADSGSTILLTERGLMDKLRPPAGTEVVTIDDPRLATAAATRPEPVAHGRNLAYIIYTSGSTGRPKSVMIEHRSAVNRLCDVAERFRLTAADVSLPVISISFEALVRETFAPMMVGGSVAMLPPDGPRDPATVIQTIRTHGVTVIMVVVPSLLEAVIAHDADPADFRSLRLVGTGGEVLRPQDAAVVMTDWGCELVNQYGPTETTMMSCMHTVRPADLAGRIPVGPPLSNAQVFVLDRYLNPAPVGVAGEVYLAGVGVARGYLGQPALSAERFVANPFGPPGTRMYRSGDLARWRFDGVLDFLGRVDDQVKVRGFRIELGEIEVVLASHPRVAQAAVIVREDRPGDKRLAAYLVPALPEPPQPAELRDHLSRTLPDYMIPAAFVPMAALPLRGNGKLDRGRLPAPDLSNAVAGRPPRSPREQLLCELIAQVLGLPSVGVDDDFFALGGHSLLAARLISLVRETLGEELAMRSLFEAPTVAGLVERFGLDTASDSLQMILPLRPRGQRPPLFCLHPGGGLSWSYVGLLRLISPDVPVYGVQARGLTEPDAMPDTVDSMASEYLAHLQAVQPAGPYHLLGWSFGGVVAHEMAAQLRERGHDVGLLAMLDSYPDLPAIYRIGDRDALAALLDPDRPDLVPTEGSTELAQATEILRREGGALAGLSERQIEAILRTMAHNRVLARHFVPRYFDGDLLFFSATRERPDDGPTAQDWLPHLGGEIDAFPIDAAHQGMTQPAALREIGRILAARLARHAH